MTAIDIKEGRKMTKAEEAQAALDVAAKAHEQVIKDAAAAMEASRASVQKAHEDFTAAMEEQRKDNADFLAKANAHLKLDDKK